MKKTFRFTSMARWGAILVVVYFAFVLYSLMASGLIRDDIQRIISKALGESSVIDPGNRLSYEPIGVWGNLAGGPWYWSPDGVFHATEDQASYRRLIRTSLTLPFADFDGALGWRVSTPIFVPMLLHMLCVFLAPLGIKVWRHRRTGVKASRLFSERVLYSAVYAFLLVMVFQLGRMVWSSSAWDRVYWSTLLVVGLGSLTYFAYCAMFIVMYLYCVLGTAGLKVRCKPGAKKCSCIRCGYSVDELERCPECDLEVGAFVQSKIRINYWYLGAMLLAACILPVIVSSVYSILG